MKDIGKVESDIIELEKKSMNKISEILSSDLANYIKLQMIRQVTNQLKVTTITNLGQLLRQ